ncbi:methionyl-tRNA formyltransferase [Candidatus Azambacteria bacterium]|nr:methionyl-tRNA formyltransferase [Candidatus Azambacteria bacterium]MBI3685239.1 methionyl-tRNA formyltransferase [Candidatus Azambacteria bacterium]
MKRRRIIFMGTPEAGAIILERLILSDAYKPALVITQPDKPTGKKQTLTAPPVKITAQAHHIEVWQPEKLNNQRVIEKIAAQKPDCIIVAVYGKLIPEKILNIPACKTLNVHPSLLPRHRGPSPIQYTILEGDTAAGVSIMLTDKGMDTGPVLAQKSVPIEKDDTAPVLSQKLFNIGADMLLEMLPLWFDNKIIPVRQDDAKATLTALLKKEDGKIKPSDTAQRIKRMVRALAPWPGVYLEFNDGRTLKILKAEASPCEKTDAPLALSLTSKKELCLHTADGCLVLETVHPESKKPMSGYEFYIGWHNATQKQSPAE